MANKVNNSNNNKIEERNKITKKNLYLYYIIMYKRVKYLSTFFSLKCPNQHLYRLAFYSLFYLINLNNVYLYNK